MSVGLVLLLALHTCAGLLGALCWPTWCTVLAYLVHCAGLLGALCWPTWCTVLPYLVHCAGLLGALCWPTWCTVLAYLVHCAGCPALLDYTLIHPQLLNAQFSDAGNGASMTSGPPPDGDRRTDIPTHTYWYILHLFPCACQATAVLWEVSVRDAEFRRVGLGKYKEVN